MVAIKNLFYKNSFISKIKKKKTDYESLFLRSKI